MKLEIDFDISDLETEKSDGQVNIKMPKDKELKFRLLNIKYDKRLSKIMRKVAIQLISQIEEQEAS